MRTRVVSKQRFLFLRSLIILYAAIASLSCRGDELLPSYTEYVKTGGVDYLEFISYGDAGKGSPEQQLVADQMSLYVADAANDVTFILNLGDNFYEDGVDSVTDPLWTDRFEDVYDQSTLNIPFYSILGNHDYRGDIQAQLDYVSPVNDRWKMPARYYAIRETLPDSTVIDFFLIDTERIFYGDTDQLLWLEEQLESSGARWIIVAGHRPLYSYGQHGSNGALIVRLQWLLDNRADLYIAGHEHDLQILGPLNGVTHIVNGSAGGTRPTGVGNLTTFAAGKSGFMGFLISNDHFVCRVIDKSEGLIYTAILKEKN